MYVNLAFIKLIKYMGKTLRYLVWLVALVLYPKYNLEKLSQH